jgi:hypothetical protein
MIKERSFLKRLFLFFIIDSWLERKVRDCGKEQRASSIRIFFEGMHRWGSRN